MAIVYRHRRLDKNEVFYVGIGKKESRAYSFVKSRRNKIWNDIKSRSEVDVEIVARDLSWELACELEQLMISEYGRIDLGTGILANLTDGGEGTINAKVWNKGLTGLTSARKGIKLTQEQKNKISKAKTGTQIGGKNPRAKMVLDTFTGVFYDCLKDGCNAVGLNYHTENGRVNSNRSNKRFIYV
jgi:hypothetical protein